MVDTIRLVGEYNARLKRNQKETGITELSSIGDIISRKRFAQVVTVVCVKIIKA